MTESSEEIHEVAASDFERGIQYGEMIHRMHEHEQRNARLEQELRDLREHTEAQLTDIRESLTRHNEVAEVALEVAAEVAEEVHEVAEEAHEAAEEAEEAQEEVREEAHEESTETPEVTVVSESAPPAVEESTAEKPAPKRRHGRAFGRR